MNGSLDNQTTGRGDFPRHARSVVVMGVSGSGKSTIGTALAARLRVPFVDGDSLHPASNVAKMARGTPLDDADRAPWLIAVGRRLAAGDESGLVVACSALKRSYRDVIRQQAPQTIFVHLAVDRELLQSRMTGRPNHFMPVSLLDSQLAALEPLGDDERGWRIDGDGPVAALTAEIARMLAGVECAENIVIPGAEAP